MSVAHELSSQGMTSSCVSGVQDDMSMTRSEHTPLMESGLWTSLTWMLFLRRRQLRRNFWSKAARSSKILELLKTIITYVFERCYHVLCFCTFVFVRLWLFCLVYGLCILFRLCLTEIASTVIFFFSDQ